MKFSCNPIESNVFSREQVVPHVAQHHVHIQTGRFPVTFESASKLNRMHRLVQCLSS